MHSTTRVMVEVEAMLDVSASLPSLEDDIHVNM